ncbi:MULTISPECIES: hypothetical protein [Actinomadura]|uniref:hypothetical protein n=1 Tax=Actinomadura TaxID=1988 RepID=UPI00040950B8|nr:MULTISPECIES: hypothetical protein [Actinomadura]RSN51212.1 hypothetical protein DMH08_31220 [Actinomadura sp. WAC 06369]
MDEREFSEESGHEPNETHDRAFAPVNQGSDARGRTRPGTPVPHSVPDGEEAETNGGGTEISGTGTPGVTREHPDTLPPDERGVTEAERHDDSR